MLLGHAEPNPAFSSMMQVAEPAGDGCLSAWLGRGDRFPPRPLRSSRSCPRSGSRSCPRPSRWSQPRLGVPARPPRVPRKGASCVPRSPMLCSARSAREPTRAISQRADMLCRKALAEQPLDAALHFYRGLVLRELRRPDEAEKSFLNSLYLDKSFAMAHYHLGLLLLAEGRSGPGTTLPDQCRPDRGRNARRPPARRSGRADREGSARSRPHAS